MHAGRLTDYKPDSESVSEPEATTPRPRGLSSELTEESGDDDAGDGGRSVRSGKSREPVKRKGTSEDAAIGAGAAAAKRTKAMAGSSAMLT